MLSRAHEASSIVEVEIKDNIIIFTTDDESIYRFSWLEFAKAATDIPPSRISEVKLFKLAGFEFHYHSALKNFIVLTPTGKVFALTDGLFFSLARLVTTGTPRRYRMKFKKSCDTCKK